MPGIGRMSFAVIAGIVVVIVSVFVAWVTFNVMESSAQVTSETTKFTGAFAAFVFTAGLLSSIILQFHKQIRTDHLESARQQIEAARQQIQELQAKLTKGAPCPPNYTTELDEKHNLVFARPSQWLPSALYQYINKKGSNPQDPIPANFNVLYTGEGELRSLFEKGNQSRRFDPDKVDLETLYTLRVQDTVAMVRGIRGYEQESLTQEYVLVDSVKSLKYVHFYTFEQNAAGAPAEQPAKRVTAAQSGVFIYVPRLRALYEFTFTDNEEDYLASSETFSTVLSSVRFL